MVDSWSMKKVLGIAVLVLLLSTNIYANEVYLTCDNNRIMGYYKSGGVSDKPGIDELDTTFKINAKKKRIYEFNRSFNGFIEKDDSKWSEAQIKWITDRGNVTYIGKINRFESTYIAETIFRRDENPKFKKLVSYYKCRVGKKKF